MGRAGQIRRLGDLRKRIGEAKTRIKESGVGKWFENLPVNLTKDQLTSLIQARVRKVDKFKRSPPLVQADYLLIVYETIQDSSHERFSPVNAITIAKEIEKRLGEYDENHVQARLGV